MGRWTWMVMVLGVLQGCEEDPAPGDSGVDAAGDTRVPDGGLDSSLPDGGIPEDERPATLSPLACQADLEIVLEEALETRVHPLDHKGEFFGIRRDGSDTVLLALASGTELARSGQTVPGFDDQTLRFDSPVIAVAPDYGPDNSPDYPLAFNAFMSETGDVILRSDGEGGLSKVIAEGDAVNLGGTLSGVAGGFTRLRMSRDGTVMFTLIFQGSREQYLVQQRGPGAGLQLVIGTGTSLDDGHQVATIEGYDLVESPLVRVGVRTSAMSPQIGYAYLQPQFGGLQCVLTDTPLRCPGGIPLTEGENVDLDDFASDGFSIGAVVRGGPAMAALHYRAGGTPRGGTPPAVLTRGVEVQGFSFNNFKHPRACERDGSLFFVGQLYADTTMPHDELMRVDARGTITQLTDFGSLLDADALLGEVPDEILNVALGYGCDAILRTTGSPREGTAPYEGYWVSYYAGDTIEILDETAGRDDNGNGMLMGISRGRSGIDPNADWTTATNVGPTGSFTMLAQRPEGDAQSIYVRATQPRDRCRAPNVVNSSGDADDAVPGDGRCDTGETVAGDPECTFRAMIQETNASPGSDLGRIDGPRTIRLESPLPAITSALVYEGDETVLNGEDLSGDEVGLQVDVRGVELNGLRLEGFPSHGLRASEYVQLDDVWSRSNCGWGVWLEAGGSIAGSIETPARFENNGVGDECSAGGLYLAGADLKTRFTYVLANTNDGPGIASIGPIETTGLETSDNEGDGVLVDLDASTNYALFALYGTITANGNRGNGLTLLGGRIRTSVANVVAENNCGFGLWVEDAPALLQSRYGRMPGSRHIMNNNGRTPTAGGGGRFFRIDGSEGSETLVSMDRVCGGGGISITGLDPDGQPTLSRIDSVDIEENQGPGIASSAQWFIGDASIRANFGPGILIAADEDGEEAAHERNVVHFDSGRAESVVADNLSYGLDIRSGAVLVEGNLTVDSNVGAGIRVLDGDVRLNTRNVATSTTVRRSGRAALDCQHWEQVDGEWIRGAEAPCQSTAGVFVESGNIDGLGAIIRDNAGPGLSAASLDETEDYGIITLTGGEVCGNDEADVAEELNYTSVTTDCS